MNPDCVREDYYVYEKAMKDLWNFTYGCEYKRDNKPGGTVEDRTIAERQNKVLNTVRGKGGFAIYKIGTAR